METKTVKEQALDIIETLPDTSSWDDVMYRLYVRESIDKGIADADAGKVRPVEEVRKMFGLSRV